VLIAKAVGQPGQDDLDARRGHAHDFYRPMVLARQTAGFDADGDWSAGRYACAAHRSSPASRPTFMRNGQDLSMMNSLLKADMG